MCIHICKLWSWISRLTVLTNTGQNLIIETEKFSFFSLSLVMWSSIKHRSGWVLYGAQRGWCLQRDGPWGVGHVVFLRWAGCSCSLRKTDQKSPSGLHNTSTQGEGILMRLSGFSVQYIFLTVNSWLTHFYVTWKSDWCCLLETKPDNSNLDKASN